MTPRDHPGGPWEQQEGHEVARHRTFVDLGVISGLVYVSFWISKCVKKLFIFRFVLNRFLGIPDSIVGLLGVQNWCFRIEHITKIQCSCKSFLKNFRLDLECFFDALGHVFLTF